MQLELVTKTIEVPKNTGPDGFMVAVKSIIRIPRVKSIEINAKGVITYSYYKIEGSPDAPMSVEFETVTAAAVIRNTDTIEIQYPQDEPAPLIICRMFRAVRVAGLVPIQFVSGVGTSIWEWHASSGMDISDVRDELYGLPLVLDPHIPDEALVLCAGYDKNSTMIDAVRSFKAAMLP
jgi:hypothetical protein